MSATADHRADMHQIATDLRRSGRPIWIEKISVADIFHNEDMTFENRRDAVVARLRGSWWFTNAGPDDEIIQIVEELAEVDDADYFDLVWDAVYDEADYARVWIETTR